MKKLLYILLFVPFGLFGQVDDPCYSVNNIYEDVVNQNPPLSIDLSSGWNLIGYPCSEPVDAEEVFSSIVEDIIIVKDNSGGVYMPDFGFNGIGQLETLEGYQIKLFDFVVDFSFCSPIYLPDYLGCTDCESLNFNPFATLDDGSCNYDSDGDGIYDADEVLGCLDELACNYNNVIGATDNGGCMFPEEGYNCFGDEIIANIGDTIFGGIVFYIDHTDQHGLVAALNDLEEEYKWGCSFEDIIGADGTAIGTGWQNTLDILNSNCLLTDVESNLIDGVNEYSYSTPYAGQTAAGAASDYEGGGFSDWYLPSRQELYEIYDVLVSELNIGGFENDYYSSSSENNFNTAWVVNFSTGVSSSVFGGKSYTKHVRPIRSF